MDVTPGPQLRRQITKSTDALKRFDADKNESLSNDELPEPDWHSWAAEFSALLGGLLPLLHYDGQATS